jgi:hypothetical protein
MSRFLTSIIFVLSFSSMASEKPMIEKYRDNEKQISEHSDAICTEEFKMFAFQAGFMASGFNDEFQKIAASGKLTKEELNQLINNITNLSKLAINQACILAVRDEWGQVNHPELYKAYYKYSRGRMAEAIKN